MHKPALQTPSSVTATWAGATPLRARGPSTIARPAGRDAAWLDTVPAAARARLSTRAVRLLRSMD